MKPEIGVCYYPEHWDESLWLEDARRMKEAGLSWVRIGEFAWSRLEAQEGVFTWDWLDRSVDILGKAGLKVVMGTPSATPPRWVVDKFPDMLPVDIDGRPRNFGARRHYSFSHLGYRALAASMAGKMAARYGENPYVQAWQIDNEYGCHDTTLSYAESDAVGFRDWLAQKYQSPDALNRAWGNVFWSMEYEDFDQIDLPNLTVAGANQAHWLDFRRYISQQVVDFNKAQVDAMRPHTSRPLIHNYMGRVTDFDHFDVQNDLDIASWDSYPMGFLEQVLGEESEEWKARFSLQGDPDFQSFHHDLYRAVGKGRWWIMEQQPGPVNWAPYNPIPLDGVTKLWTMEAVAHGAEVVCYFRWRQARFAQEQMHAGLLRPDSVDAPALREAREAAHELQDLGEIKQTEADVAIVFDYESQWAWEIEPQGKGFDYFRLVFEQYRALRKLGLSVDFVPSDTASFGKRKLVLIPALLCWNDQIWTAIESFDGIVLAGPRTGSKDANFSIPDPLPPQMPGVDVLVARVGSLRPNTPRPLKDGGAIRLWFEELEASKVREQTTDGAPVLVGEDGRFYLGGWLDEEAMLRVLQSMAEEAGLQTVHMPEGVRRRDAGAKRLITNYNPNEVNFEGDTIPPASYIWKSR